MTAKYVFDEFTLDLSCFELRRDHAKVPVQPKVLRTLLHLVEHRDRTVSADELLRVLWPGERVGHGSIKRAVIAARRALGEAGGAQTSIRTVRGFGYRFIRTLQPETTEHERWPDQQANVLLAQALAGLSERSAERLLQSLVRALTERGGSRDLGHATARPAHS